MITVPAEFAVNNTDTLEIDGASPRQVNAIPTASYTNNVLTITHPVVLIEIVLTLGAQNAPTADIYTFSATAQTDGKAISEVAEAVFTSVSKTNPTATGVGISGDEKIEAILAGI